MSENVWREELRGRSLGAIFVSVFAFVWASLGVSGLFGAAFLTVVSAGTSVALIVAALHLRKSANSLPKMPTGTIKPGVSRRFNIVCATEGVAIGVAVFGLVRLGSPEWIPATVALIVGVHFFPLAALFRVRLYYVTGVLLCAIFALTATFALASGGEAVWFVLPGIGSAFVLWGTAGILVASGLKKRRAAIR